MKLLKKIYLKINCIFFSIFMEFLKLRFNFYDMNLLDLEKKKFINKKKD